MFDFSSKNEGKWFYFDPTNEEAGGIYIRVLNAEVANKIFKSTTRERKDIVVNNRLFEKRIGDDEAAYARLIDYCIVDWKGVSLDGEPLECTTPNKVKIMRKSVTFSRFYDKCMEELEEEVSSLESARVKN